MVGGEHPNATRNANRAARPIREVRDLFVEAHGKQDKDGAMTAGNAAAARSVRCRFCYRMAAPGLHRAPGPEGPICADCVETGLALVRDGEERASRGGTALARLAPDAENPCEFCDRGVRYSFLGFRRPLARMICRQSGAVICVDCLDRSGDLINRAHWH
jgi:hypothetical protein